MRLSGKTQKQINLFWQAEDGASTISFVLAFPIFVLFFLMIVEGGSISSRHVILERALDMVVRDVRIGRIAEPKADELRERICSRAAIIPDCENQLQLEMVKRDLRNWEAIPTEVQCIDRSVEERPSTTFTPGQNNELVFLRACARVDPLMPTTGIGRAITENTSDAAGGSYALVATAAYVVEPFRRETSDD